MPRILSNFTRECTSEPQTCCSGIISCSWDLRSCIFRNTVSFMFRTSQNPPLKNSAIKQATSSFQFTVSYTNSSAKQNKKIVVLRDRKRSASAAISHHRAWWHPAPGNTGDKKKISSLTNAQRANPHPKQPGGSDGFTHHTGSQPRDRGEAPEERHGRSTRLPQLHRTRTKQFRQTLGLHRTNQKIQQMKKKITATASTPRKHIVALAPKFVQNRKQQLKIARKRSGSEIPSEKRTGHESPKFHRGVSNGRT